MGSSLFDFEIKVDEHQVSKLVDYAIKHSEEEFNKKKKELLKAVFEDIGKPAAEGAYGTSVKLNVVEKDDGIALVASGDAVCFLEFGAGVQTDTGHPFAKNAPFEVRPGSWAKQNPNGQFKSPDHEWWIFGGVKYEYVTPRRGLYEAYKAITEMFATYAKSYLGGK